MNITISTHRQPIDIAVSIKNGNVEVIEAMPKNITIAHFKDGLSVFEIARANGYLGTYEDYQKEITPTDVDFIAYYILSKS